MNISVPLSPHLEHFVREQLASGLFRSEGDVIQAALRLLEDQSLSHGQLPERLKQNPDADGTGTPAKPASKDFWGGLRAQFYADRVPGNEAGRMPAERRSPRGLLADLRSHISADDIKDARREMRSGFPHGGA